MLHEPFDSTLAPPASAPDTLPAPRTPADLLPLARRARRDTGSAREFAVALLARGWAATQRRRALRPRRERRDRAVARPPPGHGRRLGGRRRRRPRPSSHGPPHLTSCAPPPHLTQGVHRCPSSPISPSSPLPTASRSATATASEREVELDRDVVIDVLHALEVDASTPSALASALDAVRGADPDALPATVVVDEGHERALPAAGVVTLEDGAVREVGTTLPTDLPVGYHRLACRGQDVTLIVAPPPLTPPPATWGWMAQLYALRSAGSWGCGDYADLASLLARTAGEQDAGALLVNPLHALALDPRVEASPYSPSSRRFLHPLYIRVADTAAYAAAPASVRAEVDALRPADGELVDHDAVWAAKNAALELLRPYDPAAPSDVEALEEGERDVATWYALAERHGSDLRSWPSGLRPTSGTRGCPTPGPSSPTACSSTPGASTSPTPSSPRRTVRPRAWRSG